MAVLPGRPRPFAGHRPARQVLGRFAPANPTVEQKLEHTRRVEELERFRSLVAERATWAFKRSNHARNGRSERFRCPARVGKVACGHCPMSKLAATDDTPVVADPPADKPRYCTRETISIPADVQAKTRQRLMWGTDDWIASYNRRTYVEGAFGNLKSPKTENVTRGWCFVVGLTKTSIMIAAAVAAANIRLLVKWARATGDTTAPVTVPDPPDYGHEELGPDGTINTAPNAPPSPA